MTTHIADLRGLKCPLPVLKIRKRLTTVQPGGRLEAICDDPMSVIDVPAFCNEAGHELVDSREAESGVFHFLISKDPGQGR